MTTDVRPFDLTEMSQGKDISDARAQLAKLTSVAEVKTVHDAAAAAQEYAKKIKSSIFLQTEWGALVVEAAVKAGAMLAGMEKRHGARDGKTGCADQTPLLSDLGITKFQSSKWQLLAAMPADARLEHFEKIREAGDCAYTMELALREERRLRRGTRLIELANEATWPTDVYRCVVMDPPWPMQKVDREVRPAQADLDYDTWTLQDIQDIPLGSFTDDASHLWLWTTQKHLESAEDIVIGWGFKRLVTMTWCKTGGPQPAGLPQYDSEFVILARKGGLEFLETKNFGTWFEARRREHSRKPDHLYDLVSRVSPGPRLEMFSREERDGFATWGDERGKFA